MQKIIDLLISIVLVVALITTGYYVYNAVQPTRNNVADKPTYDYSTDEPINDNESFNDGQRYLDFEFSSLYDPTLTGVKVTYIVDGWATDYVEPVNHLMIETTCPQMVANQKHELGYLWGYVQPCDISSSYDYQFTRYGPFSYSSSSLFNGILSINTGAPIEFWLEYEDLISSDLSVGDYTYDVHFKYYNLVPIDDYNSKVDTYAQYIDTFNFSYLDNTHNNLTFKFTIVGGSNNV